MSKAYLQPFLIFPDAVLGSMLVTLAGETDATPVYDPNTGSILSQPLGINSVGEVTPFHANDNVLYDLHVFAAGVSAVVGNQLYSRENVTIVGGSNGLPGTNGKSVRVQAVTGGAQIYDEFGNTVTVLDGEDGEDGTTPVKGVDYFDGINGTTPVKGVDYVDGADGIAGYIQLPALPVDPSTVPIGQPVVLPDGTFWTNVTGSWTTLAVSEAMLNAGLDGKANEPTLYTNRLAGDSNRSVKICEWTISKTAYVGGAFTLRVYSYDTWDSFGYCDVMFSYHVQGDEASGSWLFEYVGGSTLFLPRINMRYTSDASNWYFAINGYSINPRILSQLLSEFNSDGTHIVTMGFRDIADSGGTSALMLAPTPPAGDNSTKAATTEFVGKPSGLVITLSSSQTITPANGAVYYVGWSHDITLSNSSALGTRCYIQADGNCPQNSKILFTDVAGNSNGVGFGYGDAGAGGIMCERFADGWMVVGGVAQ